MDIHVYVSGLLAQTVVFHSDEASEDELRKDHKMFVDRNWCHFQHYVLEACLHHSLLKHDWPTLPKLQSRQSKGLKERGTCARQSFSEEVRRKFNSKDDSC